MRYFKVFLSILFCVCFSSNPLLAERFFADDIGAQTFVLSYNSEENSADVVNSIVGTEAFWNVGITGQNTKIANIELGVYWNEHYVFQNSNLGEVYVPEGVDVSSLYSSHATGTAHILAGYNSDNSNNFAYLASLGIAPSAELSAGAVARDISGERVSVELADFYGVYSHFFGNSDVINSSWGPDSTLANNVFSGVIDALAANNTNTVMVVSAGNSGPGENSVQSMALAFNVISVGALGNANSYDSIADFSSRSPSDFYNPITKETVKSVRPAIDISAPGENISFAVYDPENPDSKDLFSWSSGTSLSAPIVSGVVSLMKSASYSLAEAYGDAYGDLFEKQRDARVVKAILLNSAKKPSDWTNNQTLSSYTTTIEMSGFSITSTYGNVILTTQGLDYVYGAGSLNADGALKHVLNLTQSMYWALDSVNSGSSLWYNLGLVEAGKFLTATLVWNVNGEVSEISNESAQIDNLYFSNLGLELWTVIDGSHNLVAVSDTEYNNVEHLYLKLATEGEYLLRVTFFNMAYGEMPSSETYAIAFSVIPEPSFVAAFAGIFALLIIFRRRVLR